MVWIILASFSLISFISVILYACAFVSSVNDTGKDDAQIEYFKQLKSQKEKEKS